MNRPSFELSADTRFVEQELRKASRDEVVSLQSLTSITGKDINSIRSAISSAIRRLRKEHVIFASVRGVGYQRIGDIGKIQFADARTKGTRRRIRETVRVLAAIDDYAALNSSDQIRHTALISINTLALETMREPSIKKVEKAATGSATELPIAETLKALGY